MINLFMLMVQKSLLSSSSSLPSSSSLIFIVMEATSKELRTLMTNEMLKIPFLIFANKIDKPQIYSSDEIETKLGISSVNHPRWKIQQCSGVTGEGILAGMEWLSQQYQQQ